MPEVGFREVGRDESRERRKPAQARSSERRRIAEEHSPDCAIAYSSDHRSAISSGSNNAHVSGGSRFSSTSRSAPGRCSFGSDHEALFPNISIHLAVREGCIGGPVPTPAPEKKGAFLSPLHKDPLDFIGQVDVIERASKVHEEDVSVGSKGDEDEGIETKRAFSHAFRECQNRRHKSGPVPFQGRKQRRHRPASLDLSSPGTDAAVSSPRLLVGGIGSMKNSSGSFQSRSEVFPSPGTPNCRHGPRAAAFQKGWSSERVPLSANCSRTSMGNGAYLPYINGRVLPSKWEDAEKWIFSPVAADGFERSSLPPTRHRRPKSKSGPLGPHGYSPSSPIASCFDVGRVGSFAANSPFSAGVLVVDRGLPDTRSGGICCAESARPSSAHADLIMRSASIHGCSETLLESPSTLPTCQNEIFDYAKEVTNLAAMKVFMKDVATQMSPVGSSQSSPKHAPSFMASPFPISHVQELDNRFKKLEIRDVQVDDQVTLTRWPKKQISRCSDKCSTNVVEFKQKTFEAKAFSWKVSETAKCLSNSKRVEAKINAWENLQKAKAEAAIRKLEMKLEKKRSSSMERILRKLRSAQKKAGEMRTAALGVQKHQVAKTTKKASYFSRNGQISSLSGCFTCHAF